MIGQTLGYYRVLEQIGAGGMGVVYRAWDENLERDVAVSLLPAGTLASEAARKRFREQIEALSKLNHPAIQAVHKLDTQNGVDFLVMEYIPGQSLNEKLLTGPLPAREVSRLGLQLAEGLAAAHAQGAVHGDLKPANLRILTDGRLKILDFGLAKLLRHAVSGDAKQSFTESQAAAGALPYMAPEQLRGEPASARSDLHSAGAVLYEMATGQRPYPEMQGPRLIDAILRHNPVSPRALDAGIPPELERIILKCLEKDAKDRHPSANELAADLRPLARPRGLSAMIAAVSSRGRRR